MFLCGSKNKQQLGARGKATCLFVIIVSALFRWNWVSILLSRMYIHPWMPQGYFFLSCYLFFLSRMYIHPCCIHWMPQGYFSLSCYLIFFPECMSTLAVCCRCILKYILLSYFLSRMYVHLLLYALDASGVFLSILPSYFLSRMYVHPLLYALDASGVFSTILLSYFLSKMYVHFLL